MDEDLRASIFGLVARQVFFDSLEEDFELTLDEERVTALYDDIIAEMEAQGLDPETFIGVPNAGVGMLRFDAEIAVLRQQVVESMVRDPEIRDTIFSSPAEITTVCASHILVATEEEALAVMERLDGGEDFAAIADELSLDSGPGGDLGCRLASVYVPEFAAATLEAEIDELFGPVESGFGFHVILVSDRTALTPEDFEADPLGVLTDEQINFLWSAWFNEQLQDASVVVEERYGTWSPVGIAPPE